MRTTVWLSLLLFASIVVATQGCEDDETAASSGSGAGSSSSAQGGASSSSGTGAGSSTAAGGSGGSGGGVGGQTALSCDPLPAASGNIISVTPAQAGQFHTMVYNATAGDTFELADGTYDVTAIVQIIADDVTIRSASNDASAVIIDGQYNVPELLQIHSSGVTISDVTITRAVDHPIHITPNGNGDVLDTHIYRVRLIDGGEQFIKINDVNGEWVDNGKVECSHFELTNAGRPNVESCCGGCYTGGIDAHAARGWQVRGNTFVDIYCDGAGLAEHAVHFWQGSRDTLVENNSIINCARGIGFGLSGGSMRSYPDQPHGGLALAHYDGIIRNNVIYADHAYYDTGIELQDTRQPLVVHNTVVSTPNATGFFSSIDYRFGQTVVDIHNNLTRRITQRDGAMGTVSNNLEDTPLSYFVGAPGDFHLTPSATGAIDQGMALGSGQAGVDIDGETHDAGSAPDLGADESP